MLVGDTTHSPPRTCNKGGSVLFQENTNAGHEMMKYLKLFALFLMLVFCTSCGGQTKPDLSKENIKSETKDTVTSQVPDSMVRNIKQARNGDILIASYKGVFRYDGKSFINMTSTIKLPSFWDVLEDRKGNLWFASRDSGVYYYDGKSFTNFTTEEGLVNNMVFSIYEDKAGNIWFGTGGGASRYDGKFFRNFTTKEGLSNKGINSIMEDKTGKLWFGTGGDACVYDGKTFTYITNGKPFTNVHTIIEDNKGNIWLGGNDGLWRYDGKTFTNLTQKFVGYIYEDKKGNIWTSGGTGEGTWKVSRYDGKSLSNEKPSVTDIKSGENCFFGISEADDGSIWFGCLHGVYRYDGNTITDFKGNEVHK